MNEGESAYFVIVSIRILTQIVTHYLHVSKAVILSTEQLFEITGGFQRLT